MDEGKEQRDLTMVNREMLYMSHIITPSTSCVETGSQDLLEELLSNLVHLIVEVPLL